MSKTNPRAALDVLGIREYALSAEIRGIDAKITRLLQARKERSLALQRNRAEQARAILGGQDGTLRHEPQD